MRLSRHPIPTKMHSTFSMNIMILLKVWEADGMIWFSASTCFQLVTRLLLISTMWINKSKTYRASGVLRKNGTKTIRSKLKISNSKILTVKVWKNMLMITYTNLMHWVKNLIFDEGESPLHDRRDVNGRRWTGWKVTATLSKANPKKYRSLHMITKPPTRTSLTVCFVCFGGVERGRVTYEFLRGLSLLQPPPRPSASAVSTTLFRNHTLSLAALNVHDDTKC